VTQISCIGENTLSNHQDKTSELLAEMKNHVAAGAVRSLTDAMVRLADDRADDWVDLMLLDGVLGNPSPDRYREALERGSIIAESVKSAVDGGDVPAQVGARVIYSALSVVDLSSRLQHISCMLRESRFATTTPATMVLRCAAFVESQYRNAMAHTEKEARRSGQFNPLSATASDLPTPDGMTHATMQDAVEQNYEAADLVLRWASRNYDFEAVSEFDVSDSPYNDPDFQAVLEGAGTWQFLNEVWANVRFGLWEPRIHENLWVYLPRDEADFHRRGISIRRNRIFEQEFLLMSLLWMVDEGSDTEEIISEIAGSIRLPARGQTWDGHVDCEALAAGAEQPFMASVVDEWLSFRHYGSLVSEVSFEHSGICLDFEAITLSLNSLRALAKAMEHAMRDDGRYAGGGLHCMDQVVITRLDDLAHIISETTGFSMEQSQTAIHALTHDALRQCFDIWDHPLLPAGGGLCVFSPATVNLGAPWHHAENLVAVYGGDFAVRGGPFEEHLVEQLNQHDGIKAAGVQVQVDDRTWEFDVVVNWQEHLFLIEAKCLKSVVSPADEHRARKEILRSVQQLNERRQNLGNCWNALRKKAPELGLPVCPPPDDRIGLISVTNTMRFTAETHDDVVVTDELCLLRYFGHPTVDKREIAINGKIASRQEMCRIRPDGALQPDDWLRYLRNPPQIEQMGSSIEVELVPLPWMLENDEPLVYPHAKFL